MSEDCRGAPSRVLSESERVDIHALERLAEHHERKGYDFSMKRRMTPWCFVMARREGERSRLLRRAIAEIEAARRSIPSSSLGGKAHP